MTSATEIEKGKGRTLNWFQYIPNTVYGNHLSEVRGKILNVPIISQLPELPTGCEITAVAMLLQYKGIDVDKVELESEMPKHPSDPDIGYVGDPYSVSGWTIYPPALIELITKYAGSATDLTGISNGDIEKELSNNNPIVVWGSPLHGFTVHTLVLTGFDEHNFYYNDCWTGEKNVSISKNEFHRIWAEQGKQAVGSDEF